MDEFFDMHRMHGPHDGWGWGPGPFGLLAPILATLLWLIPVLLLLWTARHALFSRLAHDTPPPPIETVSEVEMLSQRYVRGEIDITTFENMLDDIAVGNHRAADDGEHTMRDEGAITPPFRPRADIPVDWS